MIAAPAPPAAMPMTPHCPPLEDRPGGSGARCSTSARRPCAGSRHGGRPAASRPARCSAASAGAITSRPPRLRIARRARSSGRARPKPGLRGACPASACGSALRSRPPPPRQRHGQSLSAGGGPDAIATAKPTVTGGGQRGIEPPGPLPRLGERRANVNGFDRRLDHGHRPAPRPGTRSPRAAAPRAKSRRPRSAARPRSRAPAARDPGASTGQRRPAPPPAIPPSRRRSGRGGGAPPTGAPHVVGRHTRQRDFFPPGGQKSTVGPRVTGQPRGVCKCSHVVGMAEEGGRSRMRSAGFGGIEGDTVGGPAERPASSRDP